MLKRVAVFVAMLAVAILVRQVGCEEAAAPPEARSANNVSAPKAASRDQINRVGRAAAADEEWKAKYQKALDRRITFEFVDTPFTEGVNFLQTISNVNFVVDPVLEREQGNTVSLKAQDMPISDALSWLSRLAGADWELRDQAIYISPRKDAARPKAGPQHARAEGAAPEAVGARPAGRLRVHLANGAEVEADQGVLAQFPSVAEEMLEEFFDPAKDGMLCYRALPPGRSLEDLRELCAAVAPKVHLQVVRDMLLVSGDDARELRRVATVMRQLLLAQRKDAPAAEKSSRP